MVGEVSWSSNVEIGPLQPLHTLPVGSLVLLLVQPVPALMYLLVACDLIRTNVRETDICPNGHLSEYAC